MSDEMSLSAACCRLGRTLCVGRVCVFATSNHSKAKQIREVSESRQLTYTVNNLSAACLPQALDASVGRESASRGDGQPAQLSTTGVVVVDDG